jgi:hypothetical protein
MRTGGLVQGPWRTALRQACPEESDRLLRQAQDERSLYRRAQDERFDYSDADLADKTGALDDVVR